MSNPYWRVSNTNEKQGLITLAHPFGILQIVFWAIRPRITSSAIFIEK
jgi:hypothetical protein